MSESPNFESQLKGVLDRGAEVKFWRYGDEGYMVIVKLRLENIPWTDGGGKTMAEALTLALNKLEKGQHGSIFGEGDYSLVTPSKGVPCNQG